MSNSFPLFRKTPQVSVETESVDAAGDPFAPTPLVDNQKEFQHGPIKTVKDLECALIASMGEEEGAKMFEQFLSSVVVSMVTTTQSASRHATAAAKRFRSLMR